ncbi:MAG: hypoxanthine phosphoribosyltransferase [Candidatus Anammoxibacter sp.]
MEKDIERVIISKEQIKERLDILSKDLLKDYKGKDWTIIAILNGSLVFLADLIRLIPYPMRLDTISASTYGDSTVPKGETVLLTALKTDIKERDVLIIDDIIDTGNTLSKVMEDVKRYEPKSIKSCVLLNRSDRRVNGYEPDYCCFDLGNDYVVGYGLDYDNKYRNLPYIGVLKPDIFQQNHYK